MTSDQVWSIVGKILAPLGGVAGIFAIYERIFSPKGKLHATVSRTRFLLPKIVNDQYANAAKLRWASTLDEAFTGANIAKYDVTREQATRCTSLIQHYFLDKIPSELPYELTRSQSLSTVAVTNGGRKPCDDVRVTIPNAVAVLIVRPGAADEYRMIKQMVSLDTLIPKETVTITAWCGWSVNLDEVRISHSEGDGKVKELLLTPKFWNWMSKNFRYSWSVVIGIVCGLVLAKTIFSLMIVLRSQIGIMPTNAATATTTNLPTLKNP
jgi:hypothetical protein